MTHGGNLSMLINQISRRNPAHGVGFRRFGRKAALAGPGIVERLSSQIKATNARLKKTRGIPAPFREPAGFLLSGNPRQRQRQSAKGARSRKRMPARAIRSKKETKSPETDGPKAKVLDGLFTTTSSHENKPACQPPSRPSTEAQPDSSTSTRVPACARNSYRIRPPQT